MCDIVSVLEEARLKPLIKDIVRIATTVAEDDVSIFTHPTTTGRLSLPTQPFTRIPTGAPQGLLSSFEGERVYHVSLHC